MKKITIAASLLGMAVAFSACDNYDDRYPEKYANVIKLNVAGEETVSVYSTEDVQELPFIINKGGWAPERVAAAHLEIMSSEDFEAYKTEMGFGYLRRIPDNCYFFGQPGSNRLNIQFEPSQGYLSAALSVYPEVINEYLNSISGEGSSIKHCIPVKLVSDDPAVSVNADYTYALLVPSYAEPTINATYTGLHATTLMASEKTGLQTIKFNLEMPVTNRWGLKYTIDTSEEALAELNGKAGASYGMIPAEAVSGDILPGLVTEYDFAANVATTEMSVTIDRAKLPYTACALPIKLASLSGKDEITINAAKSWALIGYQVSLISGYSTNDQEPSEGPLQGLFDGDAATFFHSTWSAAKNHDATYGSYVEITFAEPMTTFGFSVTARRHANPASPDHVKLFTSNDGETWTEVADITGMGESLATTGATAAWGPFTAPEPFTMLRFSVLSSRAGNTTDGSSHWNAAELSVYPAAE